MGRASNSVISAIRRRQLLAVSAATWRPKLVGERATARRCQRTAATTGISRRVHLSDATSLGPNVAWTLAVIVLLFAAVPATIAWRGVVGVLCGSATAYRLLVLASAPWFLAGLVLVVLGGSMVARVVALLAVAAVSASGLWAHRMSSAKPCCRQVSVSGR